MLQTENYGLSDQWKNVSDGQAFSKVSNLTTDLNLIKKPDTIIHLYTNKKSTYWSNVFPDYWLFLKWCLKISRLILRHNGIMHSRKGNLNISWSGHINIDRTETWKLNINSTIDLCQNYHIASMLSQCVVNIYCV